MKSFLSTVLLTFACVVCSTSLGADAPTGIAANYVGDRGIDSDPRVIFAENFEQSDLEVIGKRWETVRNAKVMSLSPDVPSGQFGTEVVARLPTC